MPLSASVVVKVARENKTGTSFVVALQQVQACYSCKVEVAVRFIGRLDEGRNVLEGGKNFDKSDW